MAVTLKQIAELAGVSRGTVDRSLNNRGGINPDVDKRIKQIAQKLRYKPNRAGKALAIRKNPPRFGVVLNSVDNRFFDVVKCGMYDAIKELSDFGAQIFIKETKGYDIQSQLTAIDEVVELGVRAVAIMPINDNRIADKINALVSKNIAVVTVNTDIENTNRLAYIGCDYLKSGKAAAGMANFIVGSKANILIVTGSMKNLGHNLRVQGFQDILETKGNQINIVDVIENFDDDITSYKVTKKALDNNKTIDMIYITSAGVSGVVRAADESERNIKIISFDDTDEIIGYIKDKKIAATICQQPYQQGYNSINTLFDYVVNGISPKSEYLYTDCDIKIKENIL